MSRELIKHVTMTLHPHSLGFPSATLDRRTTLASALAVLAVVEMRPYLKMLARSLHIASDYERSMRQVERLVGKP